MHILQLALVLVLVNVYQCQEIVFPDTSRLRKQCVTASGQRGFCRNRSSCPSVVANSELSTPICGNRFVVCCPLKSGQIIKTTVSPIPISGEVSAPPTSFECGSRGSLIVGADFIRKRRESDIIRVPEVVGGTFSFRNSWPWMALLGRKRRGNNDWFCDGVLINDQWILTAAHCVVDLTPFFVRLGEHDFNDEFDSASPEDYEVESQIFYPDYDLNEAYHDLALLKLSKKVLIKEHITPVCLPWGLATNNDYIGEQVTLTGWGAESFRGRPSSILQEVNIEVFDPKVCDSSYSALRDFSKLWPSGMDVERIVCAGDLEGGKDACQGDSGGPLVHNNQRKYTLIGIVSRGHGCGKESFPGLYAPVAQENYLAWIKRIAF